MKTAVVLFFLSLCILIPAAANAQLVAVTGRVKNQLTGEGRRNVAVFESVSGVGTITDSDGNYQLLLNPGQRKLEMSSTGFSTVSTSFQLKRDTVISVELTPLAVSPVKVEENPGLPKVNTPEIPQKPSRRSTN